MQAPLGDILCILGSVPSMCHHHLLFEGVSIVRMLSLIVTSGMYLGQFSASSFLTRIVCICWAMLATPPKPSAVLPAVATCNGDAEGSARAVLTLDGVLWPAMAICDEEAAPIEAAQIGKPA